MERGLLWRLLFIAVSVVVGLVALVPNFVGDLPAWWKGSLPAEIPLGLDLRGGIHLVLQVETDKAVENSVDRLIEELRREAREKEIATRDWKREGIDGLSFTVVGDAKVPEMEKMLSDFYGNLQPSGGAGTRLQYKLHPQAAEDIKTLAVDQALETIRNRVDQFGVAEPTIQKTGEDSILVQLPGVQDPERAKSLIGRTAQLQFQIVADDPKKPGVVRVPGSEMDPVTRRAREEIYHLEPTVLMSGEVIADARHRPGDMGESPFVSMTFNSQGAHLFERITGENTGRRLAIVLDGKVQSAPVIRERIGGGSAVITGNFSLDEARDLAIVLRAGALPAPVTIAEERTVGPSLGQDSINAGMRSFMIGGALTVLSMILYYKLAGAVADAALLINVILLMASLAVFRGVLTLPGIAGIVLTIGMAVDANVLINERIREELRAGRGPHAALEAGYSRALPAIIDSNATTFLAGLILFQFGSGPVKGFALTLCIGILTTMYSAVFCSRAIHELIAYLRPKAATSI